MIRFILLLLGKLRLFGRSNKRADSEAIIHVQFINKEETQSELYICCYRLFIARALTEARASERSLCLEPHTRLFNTSLTYYHTAYRGTINTTGFIIVNQLLMLEEYDLTSFNLVRVEEIKFLYTF